MKKIILIIGIIFLLVGASVIPSTAINKVLIKSPIDDDIDWWPMFHHDLNHSGYSTSNGPETNNVLWAYQADDKIIQSSPAVVDNKVYFGDHSNSFYCLNSDTGEEIWKTPIPYGITSSAAVENGKVYFGAGNGNAGIYCLNATSGNIIWRYQTPGEYNVYASPSIYKGKVFIGAIDPEPGCMYCLDADTGEEIWVSQAIDRPGSAAVYDDRVYFGSYDSNVYCLDADNGTVIWKYKTESKTYAYVTIYDDKLYAGGSDGLHCLNMENGGLIWEYPTDYRISSTPCTANGNVYFVTNGYLYCLNATSGEKIWDFDEMAVGSIISSPAYADGKIYIGPAFWAAKLYCLDADSGEKIWDFNTAFSVDSSPAIADGKVYVGLYSGEFLCFGGESDNKPPCTPKEIFGPTSCKLEVEYTYNTSTYDPDGDQLYYLWDGAGKTDWLGPFDSNETVEYKVTYKEYGYYPIEVIVQDSHYARSDWARLDVTVSRDKTIASSVLLKFLEQFPLLKTLLLRLGLQ
jgi:outer membrane protein assembly factor BamB